MSRIRYRNFRAHPYFTIDNCIIDAYGEHLGPTGLLVYFAIARRVGGNPDGWGDMRTLARDARVGVSTARARVAEMERMGLLAVTEQIDPKDGQQCNLYDLLTPNPEGPPADWRERPKPARETAETLAWERPRKVPPRQVVEGGAPRGGGGASTSGRGGRHQLAPLPIPGRRLTEEESSTPDKANVDVDRALVKMNSALANIKAGAVVPDHLRLTGAELEQLAARPGWRRDVERYRKGIGA
jgi:hypothetical protein